MQKTFDSNFQSITEGPEKSLDTYICGVKILF